VKTHLDLIDEDPEVLQESYIKSNLGIKIMEPSS
jgi:hypothetical protein